MRVRVPFAHTSDAKVPKVVKLRDADDQTLVGIVAAKEVDAVRTRLSVLALMVLIAEVNWLFVLALMTVAKEVEAVRIALLVLALTLEVTAAVCVLVLVLIFEASEVEAVRMVLLVLALTEAVSLVIAEPSDEDAVVRLAAVASDPEVKVASVKARDA